MSIDNCELYDKLKGRLSIDIRTPAGIEKLAASIMDDWSRRPIDTAVECRLPPGA